MTSDTECTFCLVSPQGSSLTIQFWSKFSNQRLLHFLSVNIVKPDSTFNPPRNRDPVLDIYIDYLTKYPLEEVANNQDKIEDNLTRAQWNGIKELRNNQNLVIKKGDKGGACVVMDSEFYHKKVFELVNDKNTYQELNGNIDKKK